MKRTFLAVVLIICATEVAQNQPSSSDAAVQQITEMNRRWAEAINKGDARALEKLLADDIVVTAGNGMIRDKAAEIKDAAGAPDPDFKWIRPFVTDDLRVRVYKNAAVVAGRAQWAFSYKGNEMNNERRYTHMYVKYGDEWKIVAQQVSANLYRPPSQ